ncbi:MAG: hypothetical protein ACOX0J_08570 [Thermoactinomyces vulgaris]
MSLVRPVRLFWCRSCCLSFKTPTRTAIATSLAIAFVSSSGSVAAKLVSDQILLLPSVILAVSGLIASPAGAMVSKKSKPSHIAGRLDSCHRHHIFENLV